MRNRDRLALEQSKVRERINELLGLDELSTEQRDELRAKTERAQELEVELRAAIVADPDPAPGAGNGDAEDRELANLVERANVGVIFDCAVEHRAATGAEKELQDHLRLGSNQIPLAMLRSGRVEHRAVTPAPADVDTEQQPIIPDVFPMSCAAFLGIDMPTVGVGEKVFPVLTTSATAHTPAENADADDTTGAFSADVLSPSRIQAAFFWSREDGARFAGMAEALRQNLSDALADKLDQQILAGTNGLFNGTNLANHNVNAVTGYANYVSDFAYSRVDGKYASTTGDLRIVMGSGTYAHAASLYRGTNADQHALARLMADTGGVKVSAHVPAVASNKQNGVIRLGMRRDAVAPVWQGVTLIPDEVTKAKQGQIQVTAVMLHAVKILRTDGFWKQQTQHA